jgi:hypothetical protein
MVATIVDSETLHEDTSITVRRLPCERLMATGRPNPQVDNTEELATTIGLYVLGESSLGKAAEQTGVSR